MSITCLRTLALLASAPHGVLRRRLSVLVYCTPAQMVAWWAADVSMPVEAWVMQCANVDESIIRCDTLCQVSATYQWQATPSGMGTRVHTLEGWTRDVLSVPAIVGGGFDATAMIRTVHSLQDRITLLPWFTCDGAGLRLVP